MVLFDVDGVLTDGGIYLGEATGELIELKRFHIQDGLGIKLLRQAGLAVSFLTARASRATELRARELGVEHCVIAKEGDKLGALEQLLERCGIEADACAFAGDDLTDLPVLARVALPIAVANAVAEVKQAARWVTQSRGGQGAAREIAEGLLRARGDWDRLVAEIARKRRG